MKPQLKILDEGELWEIHCASLEILERVGVAVQDEQARTLLQGVGAKLGHSDLVRFPAKVVQHALDGCAPVVLLHGRGGRPPMRVGADRMYFGTCGYSSSVIDWKSGELRRALLSDLEETSRLTEQLEHIDFIMPPISPEDVPVELVDRYQWRSAFLYTTKHVLNQCYGAEGFRDMLGMATDVAGGLEDLQAEPFVSLLISITSPLTLRRDACEVIIGGGENRIPLFIYAGPMAGATAPSTLAGCLALANAEVLAGIVLAKAVNEDVPVIYASWARTLDMKYGNVSLGAPEFGLLRAATAQLAQMYGLPSGGGGLLTDSKLPDAQSGYEKLGTAILPALSGLNMISGAAAYAGETVSTLQGYVIDDEVAGWVKRVVAGFETDDDRLALDLVADQGPGGQFIKEEHTLHYFRKEMWIPSLSDREGTSGWIERGGLGVRQRAQRLIEKKLASYLPPDLPQGVAERLERLGHVSSSLQSPAT